MTPLSRSVLFTALVFLNASLMFVAQPMMGKLLLPLLGGAPAVWNTCMVFFQGLLLAGYLYAHWAPAWLGNSRHILFHLMLLLLAGSFSAGLNSVPSPEQLSESPVHFTLLMLWSGVGFSFFVLSAGAPLLQRWYLRSPTFRLKIIWQ